MPAHQLADDLVAIGQSVSVHLELDVGLEHVVVVPSLITGEISYSLGIGKSSRPLFFRVTSHPLVFAEVSPPFLYWFAWDSLLLSFVFTP